MIRRRTKSRQNTFYFTNLITLSLFNSTAEEEFMKMREKNLKKYNPYLSSFIFSLALINLILQICIMPKMQEKGEEWALDCFIVSIVTAGITLACSVSIVIFRKTNNFQRIGNFIIYLMLAPALLEIRGILMSLGLIEVSVYYAIFVVEFFIRTVWLFMLIILFHEIIVLNLVIIICNIIAAPIISKSYSLFDFNLPYNLFMILHIFISYYYTAQIKRSYSLNFNIGKKNKWFSNILENMTSGFLFLKNGKIRYINQSMLEKCLRNKEIYNIVKNSDYTSNDRNSNNYNKSSITDRENGNLIKIFGLDKKLKTDELMGIINKQENSEKIMDILLSDIDCESIDFDNSPYHLKTMTKFNPNKIEELKKGFSSKIFFEEFKKRFYNESINRFEATRTTGGAYLDAEEDRQTFVLLGYKNLEVEVVTDEGELKKEILSYEVHCRFYSKNGNKKTENIEFIFKDITRTKIIEEKNAEFKLKSLFLSKVAHEFKNPLICITELIDQVYDELDDGQIKELLKHKASLFENLVNNNMPLIKALSNYMIILIKDLDFFSQSQTDKKSKTVIREVELKDILNFTSEIAKGLVKKNNKHEDVKILIEKTSNVPKMIHTDETKLKQILINLQSNSVKFTFKGYIKLSVSKDEREGWLKFEVTDTGPGMTDEVKMNLFKPFKKSYNKENSAGAGLGLSIVKEMVSNLGGEINYRSQMGYGTTFWFSIPIHNSIQAEVRQSNNSVKSNVYSNSHKNKYISNASVNKSIKSIVTDTKETVVIDINNHQFIKPSDIVLEDPEIMANDAERQYETSDDMLLTESKKIKNERKLNSHFKNVLSNDDSSSDKNNSLNNCVVNNKQFKVNKDTVEIKEDLQFDNCIIENHIQDREDSNNLSKDDLLFEIMETKVLNFIVADDEHLARQSTIRNLNKAAIKLNKKISIVESSDGIETLNLVYKTISKGEKISAIITDENMKFLKGSSFVEVLYKLFEIKINVPIFLVSAYEDKSIINNAKLFKEIYAKPLNSFSAEQIINFTEQAEKKSDF